MIRKAWNEITGQTIANCFEEQDFRKMKMFLVITKNKSHWNTAHNK